MKSLITGLFITTLVLSGVAIAPQTTQAACSANGFFHSAGKCGKSFKNNNRSYWNYSYDDYRQQMMEAYIERLRELIRQLEDQYGDFSQDTSEVDVTTRSAVDIGEDEATLRGRIDLNSEDEATVYFEYGRSRTNLNEETDEENIDDDDDETFSADIDDLTDNTLYYFRAVAEDEDGDKDYGSIYSFRTDSSEDDEPDLNTHDAEDIEEREAELRGVVDMNDFNNGLVFFIYGEDESDVEDVPDNNDEYDDIDEEGDDLQKVKVDNDLDGTGNYHKNVTGLDSDTKIYFSICVEFEDEDDDETILCGDIESFTTDDN